MKNNSDRLSKKEILDFSKSWDEKQRARANEHDRPLKKKKPTFAKLRHTVLMINRSSKS